MDKKIQQEILTTDLLLKSYTVFDQIIKDSGIKDEKIMSELGITRPTLRNRKKEPKTFTIEELEKLSLLLTNGKFIVPMISLADFIRHKHLTN